jgi:general stress protein 26
MTISWDEVAAHIRQAGPAHLATATRDRRPHVSTVMTAVEGDLLWFATRVSSAKASNVRENPQVALMWQPRAEVYVRGEADLIDDRAEKARVWELLPYDPAGFWGSPDNEDWVLVRVRPDSAVVLNPAPQRWVSA